MSDENSSDKNFNILYAIIIVLVMGGLIAFQYFLNFPSDKNGESADSQANLIKEYENIKINKLTVENLNNEKLKDLENYNYKINDLKDLEKGNKNPFAPVVKPAAVPKAVIDYSAIFSEFSAAYNIDLTEAERQECLDSIKVQKIEENNQKTFIASCFADKKANTQQNN